MPDTARFSEVAEALHDMAARERRKVEELHMALWRARAGGADIEPPPTEALAGMRHGLRHLDAAYGIVLGLIPHEHDIAALPSVRTALISVKATRNHPWAANRLLMSLLMDRPTTP